MKTVLALLLAVSICHAQTPSEPPQELKKLSFLIGDWSSASGYQKGGPASGQGASTLKGAWAINNQFIELTWRVTFDGAKSESRAFLSYDGEQGAYRGVFFVPTQSLPIVAKGKIEGKLLILVGTIPGNEIVTGSFTFDSSNGNLNLSAQIVDPKQSTAFGGAFTKK